MYFNTHFTADIDKTVLHFNTHFTADINEFRYFNTHFTADISVPLLFSTHFTADIARYSAFNISLILTGNGDSLPDYEYRLKSFNANRYSGIQSNYNFQMPKQPDAIAAFDARPNGELIVYFKDDEIFRCNPGVYNYNVGAVSQTMGVNGTKQTTNDDPKTITIADNRVVSIKYSVAGVRTFTVLDYIDLDPLDSIVYKSETIQIEKITVRATIAGFSYGLVEI